VIWADRFAFVVENIHLVAKWLPTLEKKIEQYSLESHPSYRVYMSAEPASTRETHTIPQGILEVSIKITNEPPTGMMANLHTALDNFNQVLIVFVFFCYVAGRRRRVEATSGDLLRFTLVNLKGRGATAQKRSTSTSTFRPTARSHFSSNLYKTHDVVLRRLGRGQQLPAFVCRHH